MPRILEQKLKKEYPNNPHAVYGTLNKIKSKALHGKAAEIHKHISKNI